MRAGVEPRRRPTECVSRYDYVEDIEDGDEERGTSGDDRASV